jgi:hypothetical protein
MATAPKQPKIWWSNAIFFISVHFAAFVGMYYYPPRVVARASLFLAFLVWQLADFGCVAGCKCINHYSILLAESLSDITVCTRIEHFERA